MNIASIFEDTVCRFPDNPAVVFNSMVYSYRHLNEEINKIVNGLLQVGLQKGDTLAILLPNSPNGISSFYAGLKLGAICVYLNPMLKGQELNAVLMDSKAKVLITNHDPLQSIKNTSNNMKSLQTVLLADTSESMAGSFSLEKVMERSSARFTTNGVEIADPAAIIYSSGTTGVPKGAVFTHKGLLKSAEWPKRLFDVMRPDDRMLNVTPLSSSMSLSGVMISVLLNGACVYLQDQFDASEYVRAIYDHEITVIHTVPTVYFSLNALPGVGEREFKSIRFAGCSGALLPVDVRRSFESRFHKRITQYYGMTEATRILFADPIKGSRRENSVGKALPDVEVKIIDNDGKEVPVGEMGEICVRFPGGMKEYWNNREETEKALINGWLHTRDVGKVDDDGFLYILDRKSDMIIVGGFNVYPVEIEKVIYGDSRVKEVSVLGIPDERLGEIPVAFVVPKQGERVTEEEIIELSRSQMAKYKCPRKVFFLEHMPKNAAGKILKRVLRENFRTSLFLKEN